MAGVLNIRKEEVLGKGLFGSVVHNGTLDGKPVAVKCVPRYSLQENNNQLLESLWLCLDHNNIVKMHHIGLSNDYRLMAMDLCSASLADYFLLKDNPKKYREPLPAQREGLLQMAAGLEYLHSKRIVHGNLKPQNILVSTGPCIAFKLSADVGQSREELLSVWMAPEVLETVHYDPRQQMASKRIDRATSDVWSLGCLFFYFLRDGRHPFGDSNMLRTLQNIAAGDAAQLKAATDESIYLNIIAEMIMKKEGDRLALVDIIKRISVDKSPHLQTLAEGEKELRSQVAEQPEETTRPADRQEQQQPQTRKYPLHNTFRELGDGSLETIERLLEQGADVEEEDESGLTILQYVVENPSKLSLDIIQILHKYGANLREEGFQTNYKRLLKRAVENQSQWTESIVDYLLYNGANVNFKDEYGLTALHYAAFYQSKYTVDLKTILVKHNSEVNERDNWGRTPLHCAIGQKTEWTASIVEYLLEQGAYVDFKDEVGHNALFYAVLHQSKYTVDLMKILVKNGSIVDEKDESGTTPLHLAVKENTEWTASIVDYLLDHGAGVDFKDNCGYNALLYAVLEQSKYTVDLTKVLVKHKSNINEKDNQGITPLFWTVRGNTEWAAPIVEYLLEQGASVDFKDGYGRIALHKAAENPSKYTVDVMTILIKHKSKVNEKDVEGRTPLDLAVKRNTEWTAFIVEFLSDNGADVNFKNKYGKIALHNAAEKQSKYTVDVMKILLKHKHKYNANEKDIEGRTPLDLAVEGNTEWTSSIVEYLREQGAVES